MSESVPAVELESRSNEVPSSALDSRQETLAELLIRVERERIIAVLQKHHVMSKVAGELGITRKGLWGKMKRLGIKRAKAKPQRELL